MSNKYDSHSGGPPPAYPQSPPQAHAGPAGGEAAGYYGSPSPHPQQYGSPAPYGQGPYGAPAQYNQGPGPYQQQYPMQYGPQPGYPQQGYPPQGYPQQGYYQDRGYYDQRGGAGAGTGICAGLLGACACLACFDLCMFF